MSARWLGWIGLAVAASVMLSLGLAGGAAGGQFPWYVSRASGLVAFALLTGAMVMGLLITTKAADGVASRSLVFDAHQFMSITAIGFIALHGGALLFDGFFHFTPLSIVVPFASPYAPLWTGLGVIAAWASVVLSASFYVRRQIGVKRWRALHFGTFATYVLAFMHGITAGTDTALPLVMWGYVASGLVVAGLLAFRISARKATAPATAAATASAARNRVTLPPQPTH